MKRPLRSKIVGSRYEIRWQGDLKDDDGDVALGLCDTDGSVIYIDPGQIPYKERSTVLHEHLEAINEIMKIRLKHDQIDQLEVGLMRLIQDNPSLISYLRSKA